MVKVLSRAWGYRKTALLHSLTEFGSGGADAFTKFAKSAGVEVVNISAFTRSERDFSVQWKEIDEEGANIFAVFAHDHDAIRLMKQIQPRLRREEKRRREERQRRDQLAVAP